MKNGNGDKKDNNKYIYQERWQRQNGYISKTYRINKDVSDSFSKYCRDNNVSAKKAIETFIDENKEKHNDEGYIKELQRYVDRRLSDTVAKSFKITLDIAENIENESEYMKLKKGILLNAILRKNIEALYNEKEEETK